MITLEKLEKARVEIVHPTKTPGRARCVLLAEDDAALRRYIEVLLQRAGYEVVSAADGLEAMKLLLTVTVDVVVTDAVMPNVSGYELCRFVRSSQPLSHLPIILLSGLDPKNAEAQQVNAFLAKPITPETLLACIRKVCV
jgi:twitching motility two-component system response regulator PilH